VVIWEVFRVGDGTLVCQCGCEQDAAMLAGLAPGRSYRMMRRLPEYIIDVLPIVDGKLPGQQGLPGRGAPLEGVDVMGLGAAEGGPVVV
jgi:hypothetical protein